MTADTPTDFDKPTEALYLVKECQRKFRQNFTNIFSESIAKLLSSKLTLKEIRYYTENLHLQHHDFPDLKQIEIDIKKIIEKTIGEAPKPILQPHLRYNKNATWYSTQAHGTPANAEALFSLIKKGKTSGHAFTIARNNKWASLLTDEEVWQCFDFWTLGKVHPLVISKPKCQAHDEEEKDIFHEKEKTNT